MEQATYADEQPTASAELEALDMLIEAYVLSAGSEPAIRFLRQAAVVLDRRETNVMTLSRGPDGARAGRQARAWLRRNLTVWLAKYG